MNKIFLLSLLLLPCTAIANDCKLFEYPDHYEVICEGNAKPVTVQVLTVQSPATEKPQTPELPIEAVQKETSAPSNSTEGTNKLVPTVSPLTHRQGRPPTADREAAAEARKTLILEKRSKEQAAPTTDK